MIEFEGSVVIYRRRIGGRVQAGVIDGINILIDTDGSLLVDKCLGPNFGLGAVLEWQFAIQCELQPNACYVD